MAELRHVLLRIHGQVQGVGYRWSMLCEAQRLGVNGWVRNRRDGTVEAYVSADAETVEQLIAWSYRGPPMAAVTQVLVVDAGFEQMHGFEQRETI